MAAPLLSLAMKHPPIHTPKPIPCRQAARGSSTGGIVEQVQREEEAHLRKALREYNLRRGHKSAI